MNDFYGIKLPEYAIIYAKDNDGKILFVRQYQHALGSVSLILPTGSLEEGEQPLKAARQELLEETGYTAGIWQSVGSFVVDGNKGCTKSHFFIAKGLRKVAEPVVDDMEESKIVFVSDESVIRSVLGGEISTLASASLAAIATNPYMLTLLNGDTKR